MECPRCFYVKGETVDEARCRVCGRSYRPAVNVYLGFVSLVYIIFVRYFVYILTGNFLQMRGPKPSGGLHAFYDWARWPVDIQFRPELILVMGLMLAVVVFVPVVMGILYGKRGGFLLAAVALILGPSWLLGALLFLSVWIAGGWRLRMNSKVGSAILGSLPVWLVLLVMSRPGADVPLATAYYVPALSAVAIGAALVFGVFAVMHAVGWNARWAGVILCGLCVLPVVLYKVWIGEDEIHYVLLSRDVGLQSKHFRDAPGRQLGEKLSESLREKEKERKAEEAEQEPGQKLRVPGLPVGQPDPQKLQEAEANIIKVGMAAELKVEVGKQKLTTLQRCLAFRRKFPESRHTPAVLYTAIRALDAVPDTSELRKSQLSNLSIRFDAGRIRPDEFKPVCDKLLETIRDAGSGRLDREAWRNFVQFLRDASDGGARPLSEELLREEDAGGPAPAVDALLEELARPGPRPQCDALVAEISRDGTRPMCERLIRDYPRSRYAAVAEVKLADDGARRGNIQESVRRYRQIVDRYRSEVDAPLPELANLSVLADLLDVGNRRRARERAELVDRQYRVALREHAFLVENSGCSLCGDEVLKAYLQIPLFEVAEARRDKLTELIARCSKGKLADNLAYELATLEPSVQATMGALEKVADDFDQTDGAALALYSLADIESKLEGNRVENVRKAVGHYSRLLRDYPESYLAAQAKQAVNRLQSGL